MPSLPHCTHTIRPSRCYLLTALLSNSIPHTLVLISGSRLFFHNCAAILSDAAIVYTVAELYVGNTRPSWTTGLNVALRKVHHLFVAGLIMFVVLLIGYLSFFVGGVFAAVCTCLMVPAIVIEHKSAWQAIQRSVQLTQGFRWNILACLAIISTLDYAVSHLLNIIFSGKQSAYSMWFSVWGYFINMLPASIFVPAVAILKAIIYLSIRGEKEGLDADRLVQEMGHTGLLSPSQIFEYQQVAVADEAGDGGVAMSESLEDSPAI